MPPNLTPHIFISPFHTHPKSPNMNFPNSFFIFIIFIQIQLESINGVSVLDLSSLNPNQMNLMPATRVCSGTIGDCAAEEEEGLDSETNRRVLVMQKKYISYETLKRDLVPCGTPGASYYNCKASGEANPYNRGCEVITRCARDVRH